MGFSRKVERQKKAATKNELQKAYNDGYTAGIKQGFTSAEEYVNKKMMKLAEVKGVGNVMFERILRHLGYEDKE